LQIAVAILGFTISIGSNVALFLYLAGRLDRLTTEFADFKVKTTEALTELRKDVEQIKKELGIKIVKP
jgi:hypothetical protein